MTNSIGFNYPKISFPVHRRNNSVSVTEFPVTREDQMKNSIIVRPERFLREVPTPPIALSYLNRVVIHVQTNVFGHSTISRRRVSHPVLVQLPGLLLLVTLRTTWTRVVDVCSICTGLCHTFRIYSTAILCSRGSLVMYDSASCSYAGALELKGASGAAGAAAAAASVTAAGVKQENWPYRGLTCGSTFQRLKESVDKAKQALADRSGYLAGAFSPPPRATPSAISPTASITGKRDFSLFHVPLRDSRPHLKGIRTIFAWDGFRKKTGGRFSFLVT